MKFKDILVPTDGSELTKTSVDMAIELAKVSGGTITAFYVVDESVLVNMPKSTAVRDVYSILEKEGLNAVSYVAKMCEVSNVPFKKKVVSGTPVKCIIAESGNHDIIVMGTLGKTGMTKLMLGSVAERVVRGAKCPVLTVRSKEDEKQ